MIHVAGRKVKVSTGQKSQSINVYSASGVHGEYDLVLRMDAPGVDEDSLRRQNFATVGEFVEFLRDAHRAQVERAPADYVPVERPDFVERTVKNLRNHKVIGSLIVVGIALVAIAQVTGALSRIMAFFAGSGG